MAGPARSRSRRLLRIGLLARSRYEKSVILRSPAHGTGSVAAGFCEERRVSILLTRIPTSNSMPAAGHLIRGMRPARLHL